VQQGYRNPGRNTSALAPWLSLEAMLISGVLLLFTGIAVLGGITLYWSTRGFITIQNVFPVVAGTCLMMIGVQNMLGGFLLAIVCGNDADLLKRRPVSETPSAAASSGLRKPGRARAA
jgi:hypothetical protein